MTELHLNEALPPGIQNVIERRLHQIDTQNARRGDDEPPRPMSFRVDIRSVTALIGVVAAIFTAGYNWRDIVALREVVTVNEQKNTEAHAGFARTDVSNEHFESLQRQLDEEKVLLEQILRGQQRRDAR